MPFPQQKRRLHIPGKLHFVLTSWNY